MHPKSIPTNYSNQKLSNMLLYVSEDFNYILKKEILKYFKIISIKLLKISERFNGPLFLPFTKTTAKNTVISSNFPNFVLVIFTFHIVFLIYMYKTYIKICVTFSKFCICLVLHYTFHFM